MNKMTCGELAALMASDDLYAVLDVRERGEYNARQIYYATSLPRSRIEFRIGELVPDATIPLVVYDEGGGRAALAAETLAVLGYANVAVLEGGLPAWEREKRPAVSGVNVPSKAFGEKVQHEKAVPDISPEDLKRLMDQQAELVIFDVRTPEEYGRFCIPGGFNVPGGELVLWAEALKQKPDATVVVNCAGRTRSIIGTAALRRLGLANVVELRNGTMGWVLAGYELETKPNRQAPTAPEESREKATALAKRIAEEERIAWTSAQTLRELVAGKRGGVTYIIDVRSDSEYAAGHIEGSIHVPGGQAVQCTDNFIAVRNARIIFISNRSARAVMAAYWYAQMGFPEVSVLQGGLQAWAESGGGLARAAERKVPLGFERAKQATRYCNPAEIRSAQRNSSTTLLDVGSSSDYRGAHVAGAHWIARGWLELKLPDHLPDKLAPIYLTCHDGEQSVFAANALAAAGYANVSTLEGGLQAWRAAGLETESGMTSCWSEPNDVVISPSITGDKEAMRRYLDWEVSLPR